MKSLPLWACLLLLSQGFGIDQQLTHEIIQASCHLDMQRASYPDTCEVSLPDNCHRCLVLHPEINGNLGPQAASLLFGEDVESEPEPSLAPYVSRIPVFSRNRAPPA